MSDTVIAAAITVCGTVFVAIVSIVTQFFVSRHIVKSERSKIALQADIEYRTRELEKRKDQLRDTLVDLLTGTDPQIAVFFVYGNVVSHIHRAQLLLDRTDTEEAALCTAINHLGLQVQLYIPHHAKPFEEKAEEMKQLLAKHAKVADLGSQFLCRPAKVS
jgi:hypothetical protein